MASNRNGEIESSVLQGQYEANYIGGHSEYSSPDSTSILIYSDKIVVETLGLEIPYLSMTNIENMDEKLINHKRMVLGLLFFTPLAIHAAIWKKKYRYTVIQYNEGVNIRAIIIDFDKNIDSAQKLIYRRMIRLKQSGKQLRPLGGFLMYENTKYGIRIQYPTNWIEDELEEDYKNCIVVVQFRKVIEKKSPFVTIYINKLPNTSFSLQEFVEAKIDELKNDSDKDDLGDSVHVDIEESVDTIFAESPAYKLVYSETEAESRKRYKQMIIWTIISGNVYEISYSAKESQYLEYLSQVEEMINSFQIIDRVKTISPKVETELNILDREDPLIILKRRFARGEITEEEYKKMREILET